MRHSQEHPLRLPERRSATPLAQATPSLRDGVEGSAEHQSERFYIPHSTDCYYTYLLANIHGMLYVGMTNDIRRRIAEHKAEIDKKSYTARYHCHRLVYFERFLEPSNALDREIQLKNWTRKKKQWLIGTINPTWRDLSEGWSLPEVQPYDA